ncbi:hypothetical protein HDU98_003090, partial [Podochytrium sp. JEL0797]
MSSAPPSSPASTATAGPNMSWQRQFATLRIEVHPALYIAVWILCSGSVILFNKYILFTLEFPFPIFLTTCHLVFATISTRILRKTTSLLNGLDD